MVGHSADRGFHTVEHGDGKERSHKSPGGPGDVAFWIRRPIVMLGAFFLFTALLTQPMANAACALMVAPIAINVANQLHLNPRTFAITIAIAASCTFPTPLEPVTAIIYGTRQISLFGLCEVRWFIDADNYGVDVADCAASLARLDNALRKYFTTETLRHREENELEKRRWGESVKIPGSPIPRFSVSSSLCLCGDIVVSWTIMVSPDLALVPDCSFSFSSSQCSRFRHIADQITAEVIRSHPKEIICRIRIRMTFLPAV